jgi:hypothetical protein
MAVPKINVDDSKLQKRLLKYKEVTGKCVASTLRRSARLMAVNLAYSVPPYGRNNEAKKKGEIATQNDILRVYTPAAPIKTLHGRTKQSLREVVKRVIVRDFELRDAIIAAIDGGNRIQNRRKEQKRITKKTSRLGMSALQDLLSSSEGFSNLKVDPTVDPSIHKRTRNDYGRVRKNWQTRIVVYKSKDLEKYIKEKQKLVGLTKAAWAACAVSVKADVQDALRGIPSWVKRHASGIPHSVSDNATTDLPKITLVNRLRWADKALRPTDHKEAIRISRQKFYRSLGKEIKEALKKASAPF